MSIPPTGDEAAFLDELIRKIQKAHRKGLAPTGILIRCRDGLFWACEIPEALLEDSPPMSGDSGEFVKPLLPPLSSSPNDTAIPEPAHAPSGGLEDLHPDMLNQRRRPPLAEDATRACTESGVELTDKDQAILEILRMADKPMKGAAIAVKGRMKYEGYFKRRLSHLVKIGLVTRNAEGYVLGNVT